MPARLDDGSMQRIMQAASTSSDRMFEPRLYDNAYRIVRDFQYENLKEQFEATQSRGDSVRAGTAEHPGARETLRRRTKELHDAREELASKELEIQNIRHRIETQKEQHQDVSDKLILADRRIANLEKQLGIRDEEVQNVKKQLELTKTENSDLYLELNRLDGELKESKTEAQHFQDLFSQSIEQSNKLKEDRDLAETNQVNYEKERQRSISHLVNGQSETEYATDIDEIDPDTLESVLDAVELAQRELEGLRFFPSAIKSARKSQYRASSKVYQTFKTLDECAEVLINQEGSFGMTLQELLKEFQVDYVPDESESTVNKLAADRRFHDKERKRTRYMPAHIRIGGKQLRIHLLWDDAEKRWLIGHVGRHLETSRN